MTEAEIHLEKRLKLFRQTEPPLKNVLQIGFLIEMVPLCGLC